MPVFSKMNRFIESMDCFSKGKVLANAVFDYCYHGKSTDEAESRTAFLGSLSQVKIDCNGKGYYKLIGILNGYLYNEQIKSKTFCDNIRKIIIQQAEPVKRADENYYPSNVFFRKKKEKITGVEKNPFENIILLNVKRKNIKQKHIDEIDRIAKNAMSDKNWESIRLEAQVLALSCRSKIVYQRINEILNKYIVEIPIAQTENKMSYNPDLVEETAQSVLVSKINDWNSSELHNDIKRKTLEIAQEKLKCNEQIPNLFIDVLSIIGDKKKLTKEDKKNVMDKIIILKNSDSVDDFEMINNVWALVKNSKNINNKKIREQLNKCFIRVFDVGENYNINNDKIKAKSNPKVEWKVTGNTTELVKKTVKTIRSNVILPEDTLEDIFNKKKDNETISDNTQKEIEKRIEDLKVGKDNFSIVSELSKKKEYLLEVGMKPLVEKWILGMLDLHILTARLNAKFNVIKTGIINILKEVSFTNTKIDNIITHIDEKRHEVEFVEKSHIIYNLLKNNIHYLEAHEVEPFIIERLDFSIESLINEEKKTQKMSKEEQVRLNKAKNNLLVFFKAASQEIIYKISHLIDASKNIFHPDELIKKINIISQIVFFGGGNIDLTNADVFFSTHLNLSIDLLSKKENKLWYQQLSFKEKVQFKGKKIWYSFVNVMKSIKCSVAAFFISDSQRLG